jgi:large subunit ribosomal protein L21
VYAVVRIAGKQFQVRPDTRVRVPRVAAEVGAQIEYDEVLAISPESGSLQVGTPLLEGARVVAEVVVHDRERTILVYHKKRRKDHRKKNGHRQPYSELRIRSIQVP